MTKEEIFSENLEIFKFYRDIKIIDSFDIYNIKLEYHNSWDWLMPVIEKIEILGYFVMINKWTSVYTGSEGERISITSVEGNAKILNTWKACILFIEWYNKQK